LELKSLEIRFSFYFNIKSSITSSFVVSLPILNRIADFATSCLIPLSSKIGETLFYIWKNEFKNQKKKKNIWDNHLVELCEWQAAPKEATKLWTWFNIFPPSIPQRIEKLLVFGILSQIPSCFPLKQTPCYEKRNLI